MAEKKKSAFLISPIGSKDSPERKFFDKVKRHLVDPVCSEFNYNCKRADELPNPGTITSHVTDCLLESDLVIADLSGLNPNVFYELAIRHAVNKPVILIAQEGTKIPFDVAPERVVFYTLDPDDLGYAKERLNELIKTVDSKDYKNESPLRSKITLEPTKPIGEQELLLKIWETLSVLRDSDVHHATSDQSVYVYPSYLSNENKLSPSRIEILAFLRKNGPTKTVHIAQSLGRPRNSLSILLTELARNGYVLRIKEEYHISDLGRYYLNNLE